MCFFLSSSDTETVFSLFLSLRRTIMEDPFIREHIEELLRNIRTQVLIKLIRPYTRVRITFIAQVRACVRTYTVWSY